MTRAVLADTGPLYAANDLGDACHQRALRDLKDLARDRREVLVAYLTFLEAHTLLLFRLGRDAASSWLTEMSVTSFINPTPEDYRHAVARIESFTDQRISLVNATLAALATRLGLEVWIYDHRFDGMRVSVWRR